MVVNYVANAEDQREKYTSLKSQTDSLNEQVRGLKEQIAQKDTQKAKIEEQLANLQAGLGQDVKDLQQKLDNAEREKSRLLERVDAFAAQVESFESTNAKQQDMLKETIASLDESKEIQLKQEKELKETTTALIEKMAMIDTLEAEKRRLVEQKTQLEGGVNRVLQQGGKQVAKPQPVTTGDDSIKQAPQLPATSEQIGLQGLVTAVDVGNKMASISLGTADGVRVGMKFFVTRGDQFICNVIVIDVDTDEAVGVLEIIQQTPQKGDTVSTNL